MRTASLLRFVGPLLILAGVVAACSNDVDESAVGSAGSSGVNYGSSGTSGAVNPPVSSSASSSGAPGAVDLDSIITIKITSDWCQKPPGQCLDAQSFTVDFANSKLTTTTCVEVAGGKDGGSSGGTQDADTSHAITAANIQTIKQRLAELQTTGYGGISDGGVYSAPLKSLDVTTKTQGSHYYITTDTTCPAQPSSIPLRSGWQELWDALRTM